MRTRRADRRAALDDGLAALRGSLQLRARYVISAAILGVVVEAAQIDVEPVNRPPDQLEGDALARERRRVAKYELRDRRVVVLRLEIGDPVVEDGQIRREPAVQQRALQADLARVRDLGLNEYWNTSAAGLIVDRGTFISTGVGCVRHHLMRKVILHTATV